MNTIPNINTNTDNTTIDLNQLQVTQEPMTAGRAIYSIFHIMMFFLAIYLSFRCNNNKFELGPFLLACCCPYIYIIYVFATKGGCGVMDNKKD